MSQVLTGAWKTFSIIEICFNLKQHKNPKHQRAQKYFSLMLLAGLVYSDLSFLYSIFASAQVSTKIQSGLVFGALFLASVLVVVYKICRLQYENCIRWCEGLQEVYGKIQVFQTCKDTSNKIIKIFCFFGPIGSVIFLMIQAVIHSSITGKLQLPVPMTLPTDGIILWIVTSIYQCLSTAFFALILGIIYSLTFIMLEHSTAILQYMQIRVGTLTPTCSKQRFYETVKETVDIHCEMMEYHDILAQLTLVPCLIFEFLTYMLFLLVWIVVFHMHEAALMSMTAAGNLVPYIMLCVMAENHADAYDDLRYTLYDLEWYSMSPKQRKCLFQIMVMADRPKLLRIGPFHVVSFEAFADMLDRVYSYGLVINNLVAAN